MGTKSNEYIIIVVDRFGFGRIKEKKKRSSSDSVQKRKKVSLLLYFWKVVGGRLGKKMGFGRLGRMCEGQR